MKKLNFEGCETITTEPYYDICNGYYDNEIKCEYTKNKVLEAKEVINALVDFLQEEDLVG